MGFWLILGSRERLKISFLYYQKEMGVSYAKWQRGCRYGLMAVICKVEGRGRKRPPFPYRWVDLSARVPRFGKIKGVAHGLGVIVSGDARKDGIDFFDDPLDGVFSYGYAVYIGFAAERSSL